jgi:hypothetical protein
MLCGDTKGVMLHLNSTIRTGTISTASATMLATGTASGSVVGYVPDGDGAGMLRASVEHYYRMWNEANTVEGGYAASHIRSTLIGKNSKTLNVQPDPYNVEPSNYNAHLTKDTCVYSCIEDSLKNVITAKRIKYGIGNVIKSDIVDKIWLFSTSEVNNYPQQNLGEAYEKFSNPNSYSYVYEDNNNNSMETENRTRVYKCFNETGLCCRWFYRGAHIDRDGKPWADEMFLMDGYYGGYTYGGSGGVEPTMGEGLAFGFCIK